jgi:hypothetical protein
MNPWRGGSSSRWHSTDFVQSSVDMPDKTNTFLVRSLPQGAPGGPGFLLWIRRGAGRVQTTTEIPHARHPPPSHEGDSVAARHTTSNAIERFQLQHGG